MRPEKGKESLRVKKANELIKTNFRLMPWSLPVCPQKGTRNQKFMDLIASGEGDKCPSKEKFFLSLSKVKQKRYSHVITDSKEKNKNRYNQWHSFLCFFRRPAFLKDGLMQPWKS